MPRKEAELNPADGPLPAFAHRLRAERKAAGLTYRKLAARAHYSHAAFVKAAGGSTMPTWDVTREFLLACGIDHDALDDWEQLWRNTKAAVNAPSRQPTAATAPTNVSPHSDMPDARDPAAEIYTEPLALDISTAQINEPGDFAQLLRKLKKSIGDPSIRELSRRSGVPRSTLADLLNPHRRRFDWEVVRRYLYACDIYETEDLGHWQRAFAQATRLAETSTRPHRLVEVSPAPEPTTPPTAIPPGTAPATTRRRAPLLVPATMITITVLLLTVAVVLLR